MNDRNAIRQKKQTEKEVAQSLADCVTNFTNKAKQYNMSVMYVVPGYNKIFTEDQYSAFHSALLHQLTDNHIQFCTLSDLMTETAENTHSYMDIVNICTSDGIHLTKEMGRHLMCKVLSMVNIQFTIEYPDISAQYTVIQKALPLGCYSCGSKHHSKVQCRQDNLCCTWCHANDKCTEKVCPVKLLPCPNCGEIGHFRNRMSYSQVGAQVPRVQSEPGVTHWQWPRTTVRESSRSFQLLPFINWVLQTTLIHHLNYSSSVWELQIIC